MIPSTFSGYFDVYMYSFRITETKVTKMVQCTGICGQLKRKKREAISVWTWVVVGDKNCLVNVFIVVESHNFSVWNFHIMQVTLFFWYSLMLWRRHVLLIYLEWAPPLEYVPSPLLILLAILRVVQLHTHRFWWKVCVFYSIL